MNKTYPYTIENGQGERLTLTGITQGPGGARIGADGVAQPGAGPPMHVHYLGLALYVNERERRTPRTLRRGISRDALSIGIRGARAPCHRAKARDPGCLRGGNGPRKI